MHVVRIPSSLGGLGKANGSEKAPKKVVDQITNFYLSEDKETISVTNEEIAVVDGNLEQTQENIYKKAKEILQKHSKPIFIGGDHSITYSLCKAFCEQYEDPGILVFDAHPDLMQPFSPATQENFLRMLIEEGHVDPSKVIIVGIRNWDKEELGFLRKHNIRHFPMKTIAAEGIHEICDSVMELARECKNLYISIDIDSVDPAFAPGTGHCEPGGLTSRELLSFLQRIKKIQNIHAIDLMEINPDKDRNDITSLLGAKILVEL